LELWQFRRALPRISARILASGADRLFALFGGNGFFSPIARWTAAATRLPLDVYMVDDLEESHRLNKQPIAASWARSWEKKMLQKANRVFVISPGYSEHLKEKYSVASSWLPIQVRMDSIQYRQYVPKRPDVRFLTFVGGVNSLYSSSLRDCLKAINQWNSHASKPFEFRLQIMSYSTESHVRSELGADASIEFLSFPDKELFERRLRESYAFFLPYSFSQDVRVMVSTSFPHKLSDYLPMGRPILVYGPDYASIPRHFRELNLPLCLTRQGELEAGLREIENQDNSNLIDRYEAVVRRCHSPDILRRVLALG